MATRQYEFIVGPTTSELPSTGAPSGATDLMTLGYADENYVQGGSSKATKSALKDVPASARTDNDLRYVDENDTIYRFDSASAASENDPLILAPTSGTGRWLKILQGLSGTFVGTTDTQTLTNKTLSTSTTIKDSAVIDSTTGTSRQVQVDVSGATNSTKTTLSFAQTSNRTITFQDSAHTVVGRDTTDTLTNKTLTAPTFTGNITHQNQAGSQPEYHFYEDPDNGSNKIKVRAAASMSADYFFTFPASVAASGQVLYDTDGAGTLGWLSPLTNPMTTLGDSIYGAASGTATRLAGNTTALRKVLTQTGDGANSAAPDWILPYETANVRSADGSNVTLTSADLRRQIFTITSARDCTLPTTNIKAGEVWVIENKGSAVLTIKASGGNALTLANSANIDATLGAGGVGKAVLIALQDAPTTPAHWWVDYLYEEDSFTAGFDTGSTANVNITVYFKRLNKQHHITSYDDLNFTGTGSPTAISTSGTPLPTRVRVPAGYNNHNARTFCFTNNNGANDSTLGAIEANTNGSFTAFRGSSGTSTWSNASNSVFGGWNMVFFIK